MAIKSQTALVKVSTTTAAAKTITGITAAEPPVVSATAHGYTDGDIIYISGVAGMAEVNDRAYVTDGATDSPLTPNSFQLQEVIGTGYTAYTSGGSAYKETMTAVGSVVGFSGFDGTADDIDTTHLLSTAKESLTGLPDYGNLSFDVNFDSADTGQKRLRELMSGGTTSTFSITYSNGDVVVFRGRVKSFSISNTANDAARASVTLRVVSEPSGPGWSMI